ENINIGGELSQDTTDATKSPAAVAASKVYFIMGWEDANGVPWMTRGPAWASDTSVGTGAGSAEYLVDPITGIKVNKYDIANGPAAGKGIIYGSIRSNSAAQLVDSEALRWVSNVYNPTARSMSVIEPNGSWPYPSTTVWR